MKQSLSSTNAHLRAATLRIARFHFLYVGLFAIQTIVFHASKVITPELLLKRWLAAAILALITGLVWFVAKNRNSLAATYQIAIWGIIFADLAFAAFNVYTQRGYASKSVLLFIIPIIVASVLVNRTALYATALLAGIAYSTTAITYFVLNFNEGYSAELYAEIGLHSGLFFIIAGLLWASTHKHKA